MLIKGFNLGLFAKRPEEAPGLAGRGKMPLFGHRKRRCGEAAGGRGCCGTCGWGEGRAAPLVRQPTSPFRGLRVPQLWEPCSGAVGSAGRSAGRFFAVPAFPPAAPASRSHQLATKPRQICMRCFAGCCSPASAPAQNKMQETLNLAPNFSFPVKIAA